jgi:hypothetical protein
LNPISIEPLPDVSLVKEKYQIAAAEAIKNYETPMMKALTQSAPNR